VSLVAVLSFEVAERHMSLLLAADVQERKTWQVAVPVQNARGERWSHVLNRLWAQAVSRVNRQTKMQLCFEELADAGDFVVLLVGLVEKP
jgi:hypothetical protein